jgi:hypothetical protein
MPMMFQTGLTPKNKVITEENVPLTTTYPFSEKLVVWTTLPTFSGEGRSFLSFFVHG